MKPPCRVRPSFLAALLLPALFLGIPDAIAGQAALADSFPHLAHEGLFPLCAGCHAGVSTGDAAALWPDPASCNGCHDGIERARVAWTPAPRPLGLVDFSHPAHLTAVAEDPVSEPSIDCAACHLLPAGSRLAIQPLDAGTCLTCHGAEPEEHYAPMTDCSLCHRGVADAVTGEDLLARTLRPDGSGLRPADHDADDFLARHQPSASDAATRCATCHVQDRCTSCHVNTALPALQAVTPAPAAWSLPPMTAAYPTPATHLARGFDLTHGVPAPAATDCSTCHTRNDCTTCHIEPVPEVINAFPRRPLLAHADTPVTAAAVIDDDATPRTRAPGVGLTLPAPRSHESPFFMTAHPLLSGGSAQTCATCHEQSFCTSCHEQPGETGFHPDGFVLRHAPAASSSFQDCASCHSTELFCRQCHVDLGMGSTGRLGGGFHDAEPLFLLRHGSAARQDLEACASCHTQNDCRQCHAETGAFGVNPHGPNFDPSRALKLNPFICSACHIGPIGGGVGGGGSP
ncbi:MAG: hypothetical protein RQ745_02650 [Longimicrobiales bacterium]|nr:hypothetical protein [Longimicrobiales bacterium]